MKFYLYYNSGHNFFCDIYYLFFNLFFNLFLILFFNLFLIFLKFIFYIYFLNLIFNASRESKGTIFPFASWVSSVFLPTSTVVEFCRSKDYV